MFPAALNKLLDLTSIQPCDDGRLQNRLFRVNTLDFGPCYLKIGNLGAARDMQCEEVRLRWLEGRLPVPRVIYHDVLEGVVYLLLAEIAGIPAHQNELDPNSKIQILVDGLLAIHGVSAEGCPFNNIVAEEIDECRRRMESGQFDAEEFERTMGLGPMAALEWIDEQAKSDLPSVFTHGDFAMPNVLYEDRKLTGIVDWGKAGIADAHRDFVAIEKSIRRNIGDAWVEAFYEKYGIAAVDPERMQFYRLIDAFEEFAVTEPRAPAEP